MIRMIRLATPPPSSARPGPWAEAGVCLGVLGGEPLVQGLGAAIVLFLAVALGWLAWRRRTGAGRPPAAAPDPGLEDPAEPRGPVLPDPKLASLSLLAAGVAHDFNNLLGAISGHLELFRLESNLDGRASARLGAVEQLLGRAAALVGQILAYTGRAVCQVQTLDLNHQVEEMTRVLRASLGRRATLRWEPAPGLEPLAGDLAQIQQVIMNLVLNAGEAVDPVGGVITLRTGRREVTQAMIDRDFPGQALQPGPHLALEVADNGPGIAPELLERIFDPFFSTKFAGRGLGLSAVQGILRSHRGGIQVASEVGGGTTFTLLFPAAIALGPVEAAGPPAVDTVAGYRGSGTILVVDDEDELRTVAAAALRRLGFDILEARDGLEALQTYQAHRDRIRLVLMDLTMPRMDGEEAYRELRRSGAMVPIVLTSGFGHGTALQRFHGRGLAGFLPKPYRLQELEATVRGALEGRAGGARRWADPAGVGLVWVPEFETGHPLLDAQHQGLVRAFNRLAALAEAGAGPEAGKALTRLVDATLTHFGIEENLMAQAGYADAMTHQARHAHLTRQVQELARQVRQGRTTLTPEVLDFLEDWLLEHFQFEDQQLARHLLARGH